MGISVDNKLTFVEQINLIVAKAHKIANQILHAFFAEITKYLLKPS